MSISLLSKAWVYWERPSDPSQSPIVDTCSSPGQATPREADYLNLS
jgi:hypothetical protein